jgi:hypothetical protein
MTNILDIGRRGLGKSTLAGYQAKQLNRNQIYFDPGEQFHNVDRIFSAVEEFQEELEGWPDEESFAFAFVPPRGDVEGHWNRFAAMLWGFIGSFAGAASFVLIVDESHRLQSPSYINDWLDEFIRRAPRRERDDSNPIDLIQTTHYPQDLNRVSWGESDYIYFFNIFDKRALKAIDEQFSEKIPNIAYTVGDNPALVPNLATPKTGGRELLEVQSETGEYRIITNPEEWSNDIRKSKPAKDAIEATERELEETYGKY